ncbi:MAG TPA: ABC transporter substrate-binding protein [Methylomirabilota bacterium]|nr:ABC transporter substrate-binding protein [Methylomirabilota bacterium]
MSYAKVALALLLAFLALRAVPAPAQELKIGFFAPLTGFAAADGASAKHSAEIAVEELNAAGGIKGKRVQLVIYDDRHDSKEAVSVANKLVEKDGVVGVVSGSYSMPSRVTAPIFAKAGLPMTVAYAVHPDVTKAGPCIFRNGFLGQVEGWAGAESAVKIQGAKRIAVLTIKNDFGATTGAAFIERARKLGAEVVSEQVYPLGEKEFSPYLTKIKEQNVDLIYHTSYYNEGSLISRKARELGIMAKLEGTEGIDSPKFLELAGPAAEGVTFTTNLNRDDARPEVQNFLKKYKAKTGTEADMVGASAYDAVRILAKGIEMAGTDAAAICGALTGLTNYPGITGRIARFVKGEVTKPVQIQVIKDGKVRSLATIDNPEVITPPVQ